MPNDATGSGRVGKFRIHSVTTGASDSQKSRNMFDHITPPLIQRVARKR